MRIGSDSIPTGDVLRPAGGWPGTWVLRYTGRLPGRCHRRPQARRQHRGQHRRGDDLGGRFFDAAIASLDALGRMPGAGSPSVGELCDIPGLRYRRVTGFPHGWFYFIAADHIDVVRLLADAQDLPMILAETDRE